jgi:hypothetical protein
MQPQLHCLFPHFETLARSAVVGAFPVYDGRHYWTAGAAPVHFINGMLGGGTSIQFPANMGCVMNYTVFFLAKANRCLYQ